MEITLTASQKEALNDFERFLTSTEQVFILKGAAGTGKTTLVLEFLRLLDDKRIPVGLMAPTGRAAFILGNRTQRGASTIHKAIYGVDSFRKNDEEEPLHTKFKLRNNKSPQQTVYVIDEASMISDKFSENESFSFGSGQLLSDLFQFSAKRKIIFIGDHAQLPPVEMDFSPALDKQYIEDKFRCQVSERVLREVLRQGEGSTILATATKIRDRIEAQNFVEFGIERGADTSAVDVDLLQPYFALSADKPDVNSVIIAYTNRQALDYNQAVRRQYYGEEAPRLKAGDLLLIARNNYAYEEELFNGNIVLVASCASDEECETRRISVKLSKDRIEQVELRFRPAVLKFRGTNGTVEMAVRILDNFLEDSNGSLGGLTARALAIDFEKRLPTEIKDRLPEIRRQLREHGELKGELERIHKGYINRLTHDPYYNAVVCKYGYAMTCHKAQGGEWRNVFVDMGRYGGTANEDYFRWAYTAITRASEKLWHYRAPEFTYISKLVVDPIQLSTNVKVSIHSENGDFKADRYNKVIGLAENSGIRVVEDLSRDYQHWFMFSDDSGNSATLSMWYNKKGYKEGIDVKRSTSDEFAQLCRTMLEDSIAPSFVPFQASDRPFAEKLVEFVRSQLEELDIQLLDITQEQYQDVFHLKTDGLAKLCLHYNAQGNYTYMKPISSLGPEDSKLEALRQRFI